MKQIYFDCGLFLIRIWPWPLTKFLSKEDFEVYELLRRK
jgi:hypothetical protein